MKTTVFSTRWMAVVACGAMAAVLGTGCNKAAKEAATPVASKAEPVAEKAAAVDPSATLVDVGGTKLTVGEADKQIKAMLGENAASMNPVQMEALMGRFRQQAAERFMIRTLLAQEADRRKVVVSGKEIDDALALIQARLPKDMTMETVMQREGLTMDQLRSNLTEEIRLKLLVESQVPTNVVVADEAVAKFYDEQKDRFVQPESVEARHILIKTEAGDSEAAKAEKKARIEAVKKQLDEGADFAKLAKENSDCPSKERGGDLGSFSRGQMVKPFEEAAFSQATNAIGSVVETQFGYHIIQVTGHALAKTNSLADVRDQLVEHLKQKQQMELFQAFIEQLKSQTRITFSDLAKAPAMDMPPMMQAE